MMLSTVDVARILTLLQDGKRQVYIFETLDISRTIVRRAFHCFIETGSYSRRPGSGGRKVISQRDDHFIVIELSRNRHSTAIAARNRLQEVRDRLEDASMKED
ncbi:uncharacterized protein [Diabrotica undecimpunctata]|uniref:uncharacterized protein n=1 Tax=Diabrotica undecimpunctata TaxID=50387 RepID=UPI003B63A50F